MGLAGTKTRIKIGTDPRNTAWSNDKNRFGHQHLEKMGWKPGQGLGVGEMSKRAMTSHVKVNIRTDNTGLGKKSMKKGTKSSDLDGESIAGLDVFQRILGRLNGKDQESIDKQSEAKKTVVAHARFGMSFIHGGYLEPEIGKKDEDEKEMLKIKRSKRTYEEMNEKKRKKEDKKRRKEDKKLKKERKTSKETPETALSSSTSSDVEKPRIVPARLAIRAKHIASKRAATQDLKSLNEIFMIKDN